VKKAILAFVAAIGLALLHSNTRRNLEKKEEQQTSLIDTNVNLPMKADTFVFPFVSEMVH
jgi:hypothetical protein